jgi:N4-gp56 family major capsid protein
VKSLQELADSGVLFKSAESELVKENLFNIIKEASIAAPVGRQIVDVINMQYGSTLDFDLADKDSMKVRVVAEGAEIPLDAESYTKKSVTPSMYGVRIGITNRMIEDANWDLVQRNLREAGRRVGLKEDEIIFNALEDTTNGFPSENAVTSAGTELAIADIVSAMKEVENNDYVPNVMVLNPEQVSELRQIDTFVEADKVGDRRVFERGWVGKIYGLDTIITTQLDAASVLVMDKNEAGGLVVRRPLTVEKWKEPIRDLTQAVVTTRMAAVCFRPKAGAKITVS